MKQKTPRRRKSPGRIRVERFRKGKGNEVHNLYAAVQHWVRANSGEVLVIGGVGVMAGERAQQFSIVVRCVGARPAWGFR